MNYLYARFFSRVKNSKQTMNNSSVLIGMLLSICCAVICICATVFGQSRFKADEIVTFSDCRNSYMVDFSPRFVYFSSDNGIWRLDRLWGESVTPIFSGLGIESAVDVRDGILQLWHDESSTYWVWSKKRGLKYYRWDLDRWYRFDFIDPHTRVMGLGETDQLLIVHAIQTEGNIDEDRFIQLDPYSFNVTETLDVPPANVRWNRPWKPHSFPFYWLDDSDLRFYSDDGSLKDRFNRQYNATFDVYDELYKRRYICYPGLGLGVVNERHQNMKIIQPGPAGKDVQCFALSGSGFAWVAGENPNNSGINLLDRKTGNWQHFNSDYVRGLESHRIYDILTYRTSNYFASDQGLAVFNADKARWKTYDRFSGLSGLELRALEIAGDELFIGGDYGLNRMKLPKGKISPAGDPRVNDLRTADIVSDGDTVWVAGLQGIFRYEPDKWQRIGTEGYAIGDEAGRCLAITNNFLWIGGERGIRELNRKTGEWRGWLSYVYLNSSSPKALAANDSLLWVGTNNGLFAMHLRKGSWLFYGMREGLPSPDIQCLQVEADTLWIGTPEGLTRFIWNRPDRDVF